MRRGVHSEEENQLVGEARAPRTDPRTAWDDPMEETRWSERGRELHQPKELALPEEGTSQLRVPR